MVGFWRRFFADIFDALVLGCLGWAIAYPCRYALSELGDRAAWLGLAISLLYAGVLQTHVCSGQTLGKRALGIQVLRRDGSFLSYGRSLGRYLVVSFVFYNGMYGSIFGLVSPRVAEVLGTFFLLAVVWAFFACFLMIPLHPLKRGLHDLASDSIVVYKGRFDAPTLAALENPRRGRRAIALMGVLALFVIGACFWAAQTLSKHANLGRLTALQQQLSKDYEVTKVNDSTFNGAHRTLNVVIRIPLRRYDDKSERERVRADVLARTKATLPGITDFERVQVRLISGFNLGIARMNMSD